MFHKTFFVNIIHSICYKVSREFSEFTYVEIYYQNLQIIKA